MVVLPHFPCNSNQIWYPIPFSFDLRHFIKGLPCTRHSGWGMATERSDKYSCPCGAYAAVVESESKVKVKYIVLYIYINTYMMINAKEKVKEAREVG